jgi:hypothetical protein
MEQTITGIIGGISGNIITDKSGRQFVEATPEQAQMLYDLGCMTYRVQEKAGAFAGNALPINPWEIQGYSEETKNYPDLAWSPLISYELWQTANGKTA